MYATFSEFSISPFTFIFNIACPPSTVYESSVMSIFGLLVVDFAHENFPKPVFHVQCHTSSVSSVTFSADARVVASIALTARNAKTYNPIFFMFFPESY
ncbi:MAG: hypothetical protein DRN29_07830 [Thermoplasmata archaeon]|nr:MAG: hypothetical protein DRN29_07830 [Thermoplasmata archaeon]